LFAGLPLRLLHALGSVLGWAIYGISPTYRRNLRANLARAGYGADARLRRAAIAHAGRMLAETPALWLRPQDEVAALVLLVNPLHAPLASRDDAKELH
jgi:KDO2-lipid IV(A) lauroyltransferase